MKPNLRDAALSVSKALMNGATSVTSNALDIGPTTSKGDFVPSITGELLLECPALLTAQLPNATTVTFDIIASVNADLSSPVTVCKSCLVMTGAGGNGAAANSVRYRPPTDAKRYYGFVATGVATVAATASSATLSYVG